MHFIAEPSMVPFLGIPRFRIVRRMDEARARWELAGLTPMGAATVHRVKVLNPDLTEDFNGWNLAKPRGRGRRPEELKQSIPVLAYRVRIGDPLGRVLG